MFLRQGNGGVVNASRSILRAWSQVEPPLDGNQKKKEADNEFAAEAARNAVLAMRDAIRQAVAL